METGAGLRARFLQSPGKEAPWDSKKSAGCCGWGWQPWPWRRGRRPCLILESTGYYCGACGVTRLVEELLQGHVEAAFRQNVYMFFVLPLAALWLVGEAACYLGGRRPLWKRRWMQALLVCVAAAGVAFTVLRNLPGLECLQPHGL